MKLEKASTLDILWHLYRRHENLVLYTALATVGTIALVR